LRNLSTSPKPFFRSVPADFILVYLLTRKKKKKGRSCFYCIHIKKKTTRLRFKFTLLLFIWKQSRFTHAWKI
jgi:hypothetical protein